MIERQREGKELKEEFKVLGSTANVSQFKLSYNLSYKKLTPSGLHRDG